MKESAVLYHEEDLKTSPRAKQITREEGISQDRLYLRLCKYLSQIVSSDGEEVILRLKYEEGDLLVFDEFVREFLTGHIENQGKLRAYGKINDGSISFGLKDEEAKTNLSLTLAPKALLYYPVGFWGSYPKVRYDWRQRNLEIIEKTSRFIQSDYPRRISEREESLMLKTAEFIRDHVDPTSN